MNNYEQILDVNIYRIILHIHFKYHWLFIWSNDCIIKIIRIWFLLFDPHHLFFFLYSLHWTIRNKVDEGNLILGKFFFSCKIWIGVYLWIICPWLILTSMNSLKFVIFMKLNIHFFIVRNKNQFVFDPENKRVTWKCWNRDMWRSPIVFFFVTEDMKWLD